MNAKLGWTLAIAAMVLASVLYGLQGFFAALSLTVFWLLLQFSRAMRVMRRAADRPIGRVGSVVMLQSKLRRGMPMLNVVAHAGSLGQKSGGGDDVWAWHDDGARLTLHFDNGALVRWELDRHDGAAAEASTVVPGAASDALADGPAGRAP